MHCSICSKKFLDDDYTLLVDKVCYSCAEATTANRILAAGRQLQEILGSWPNDAFALRLERLVRYARTLSPIGETTNAKQDSASS